MTPAAVAGLVVQFFELGAGALERLFAAHPELRDPPPAPADTAIDARIDARLREREAAQPGPGVREVTIGPGAGPPAREASAEVQDAVYGNELEPGEQGPDTRLP